MMEYVLTGLVGISGLAFVLGVASALSGASLAGIPPVAYSRACTNLALIAIALAVCFQS